EPVAENARIYCYQGYRRVFGDQGLELELELELESGRRTHVSLHKGNFRDFSTFC
ncbi:hypothetical protein E4U54_007125, partial [Claviceps lovelessii]